MRHWFLSYNTQDLALMQALEAALRQKDANAHVFFAPKSLRAGGYWLPELAKEIAQSTAFVLLVGEKGIGQWQVIEYYEAFDRRVKEPNYPVILLLHAGQSAPGLPFLHQLHRIVTNDPASADTLGKLMHAADGTEAKPGELWRYTAPYRGLAAMTEADSDFFFGRERETAEVINVLAGSPDKLPILLGNSGVGKSSLAQAGVLAALLRQGYPAHMANAGSWPQVFKNSRHSCFLTLRPGTEPLRALVEPFIRTWQFDTTDPQREKRQNEWVAAIKSGDATLRGLLDATQDRLHEVGQTKPPSFFLYIDQGEELYVRAEEGQRRRFSQVISAGLGDSRLRALMSMRSDFLGALQNDEALFNICRKIDIPPLREAALREVVSRPAHTLTARFESDDLAASISRRTAEESTKDAGALPLLSYLLDDMWTQMVKRGDGVLRLPIQAIALGGVFVERANAFLAIHPNTEDSLRRLFTLRLATVRPDGEPMRRRAQRFEFTDAEWRIVSELADHPYRLLVTVTLESGEVYAEVAHEAIFGRWEKLKEWIAAEREFLVWRSGLERARCEWQAVSTGSKDEALLMGHALVLAQSWRNRRADDLLKVDQEFIDQSNRRERAMRNRARRIRTLAGVLFIVIVAVLVGWQYEPYWRERINWFTTMQPYMQRQVRPYVLTTERESALKPGDEFKECATYCPVMIAVPAGTFVMGSAPSEVGRFVNEGPQHTVIIAKPFAVSRFVVTFDDWDACVAVGGCAQISDSTWGRGTRPAINVTWHDAQQYVDWLSRMTGKSYRLLTENEWEYAARAGTTTAYFWGDELGKGNANCDGCGSKWDNKQTAPVASFNANTFGLYEMSGNVWAWVEDCFKGDYHGVGSNGVAWTGGDCSNRVVRGGSWHSVPVYLRSANRGWYAPVTKLNTVGIRVARTLGP